MRHAKVVTLTVTLKVLSRQGVHSFRLGEARQTSLEDLSYTKTNQRQREVEVSQLTWIRSASRASTFSRDTFGRKERYS